MENLNKELAELTERRNILRTQWENEKNAIEEIRRIKQEIEELKNQASKPSVPEI